nr:LuxR family transcriptional regulator [Xaviernesmea rhizosphaerae]
MRLRVVSALSNAGASSVRGSSSMRDEWLPAWKRGVDEVRCQMDKTEEEAQREAMFVELLAAARDPAVTTEYDVLRLMRRVMTEFGFSHFMIARLPFGEEQRFSERLLLSNWPSELVQRYDKAGVFATSKLVERLRQSKLPTFGASDALLNLAVADAVEDGEGTNLSALTYGVLFSTIDGELFLITLSGDRPEPVEGDAAWLHFILLHLFDRLCRSMENGLSPREKLSTREIECLRWAAAGKSSDEIAVILGISAYTVSSYFKTATRKLDSVNRMQAIARAMRLKLI